METVYAEELEKTTGEYKVVFENENGIRLVRAFDSPVLMQKFINKLRHSKKCRLISTMRWM